MSGFVKVIGLLVISAVVLRTSDAKSKVNDHSLAEYERRSKIVDELVELYGRYIDGKDTVNNVTLRNDFEMYFVDNFDGSDDWMMDAFASNDDQIINDTLKQTKNGYEKTKEFFDTATKTMTSAFDVHIDYETLQNDTEAISKIEQTKELALSLMKKTVDDTLKYLKDTAWKTQFKIDTDEVIKVHGNSPDLANYIYDALSQKYPFRSWVVAIYNTSTPSSVCTTPIHYFRAFNGNNIWVFQANVTRPDNRAYAENILGNIPESITSYWSCYNHMEEIVQESQYNCSAQVLPLFSVFTGEMPQLISDGKSVFTKDLIRKPWFGFCESKYYAVVFV